MTATYSVAEATIQIGAPSERWLIEQLRAGRFPGRKVGRHWRMTNSDIAEALDVCANDYTNSFLTAVPAAGLTPRSRRRAMNP